MAETVYFAAKVVGGAALLVAAPYVLLPVLGFGSGGVAAGSLAAGVQATIGNVAAGSMFAALQSAGAAGVSWLTTAAVAAAGAAGGAGVAAAT